MADLTDAANPKITLAREGVVVSEGQDRLHLHLIDGSEHETDPRDAEPLPDFNLRADRHPDRTSLDREQERRIAPGRCDGYGAPCCRKPIASIPISARWYLIDFHRRFALPTACLVLALVGIPLGLSSKKSGKSGGFVLTILLVFGYYVVSLVGVSLARQGKVSPWFGAWLADLVFLALGYFFCCAPRNDPLSWARFAASGSGTTPARSPSARDRREMPSNAPPPAAASSAPVFPHCSTTTFCATSSFIWR